MLSAECYAGERCHPEPLGLGTESSRTHTFFLHSAVNVRSTTRQALQENGDPSSKHSQVRTLPRFIFYTKETDKKQIHVSDDENCWARGGCKDAEVSRARRGRVHDTDLCVEGPRPGACLRIQSMAKKQCKECRGGGSRTTRQGCKASEGHRTLRASASSTPSIVPDSAGMSLQEQRRPPTLAERHLGGAGISCQSSSAPLSAFRKALRTSLGVSSPILTC